MSVLEILPFLKDPKPEVRLEATKHLAGLSGSDEGREALLAVDGKILIRSLSRLVGDLAPVSQQALTTLINLSNEPELVSHMVQGSSLFNKVMENLKTYNEKIGNNKAKLQIERAMQEDTKIHLRLNLILLSNLSQTSSGALCMLQADCENRDLVGLNILRLTKWFLTSSPNSYMQMKNDKATASSYGEDEDGSTNAVTVDVHKDDDDEWKYVAGILANITRLKEGRDILMDRERGILRSLLRELHSKSLTRRQGIARVVRNICFERSKTMWMITDIDINILYHIMKRLAGPEPVKEGEDDPSYPDLYGDNVVRENDISIRKIMVDSLVLLASSSRNARDIMRKRKVYPIVREMHSNTEERLEREKRAKDASKHRDANTQVAKVGDLKVVENNEPTKFDEAVFKLVDYLMGDEAMDDDGTEVAAGDLDGTKKNNNEGPEIEVLDDANEEKTDVGQEQQKIKLETSELHQHFKMQVADDDGKKEKGGETFDWGPGEDDGASSSDDDDLPMMKNLNVDEDSDDENVEITDSEMKNSLATKHKDDGNESYKVGDYDRAIECYTRGIEVDAGKEIMCVLYSNRSAALTIKRRWVEAEADATTCISIAPDFARGYCRLSKCKEKQGYLEDAIGVLERGLRALPGNVMINDAVDVLMVKRSRLAEKKKTRLAKLKKERQMEKDKKKKAAANNNAVTTSDTPPSTGGPLNLSVDMAKMKKEEILNLQKLAAKYEDTKRKHREAGILLERQVYDKRKDTIVLDQVNALDDKHVTYRSIGKIYIKEPLNAIKKKIKEDIDQRDQESVNLKSRREYLQKQLVSQESELKDIVKTMNSR